MLTDQELFDTVAKHLFAQNEPSMMGDGSGDMQCAYRGDHGRKCAAGCVLPDKHYNHLMEGNSVGHETVSPIFRAYVTPSLSLLRQLQVVHDDSVTSEQSNWSSTDKMRRALTRIADEHGLSDGIVSKLSFKDR